MNTLLVKIRQLRLLRYISFRKSFNYMLVLTSYLFSFRRSVEVGVSRPVFLSVETSGLCQLKCPECDLTLHGLISKSKSNALIRPDVYRKLLDELAPELFHLILYFQGEPLLNNNLTEYIRLAHKNRIFTSLSTNGQLLNSEMARKLVESGLDKLIISVDGTTQDVYEKYRVGGNLEKTLEGIRLIVKWKSQLHSAFPLVELQFLVLRTNEHQIEDVKRLGKMMNVDRVKLKTAQLHDFEEGNELMPLKQKYSRYKRSKNGNYILRKKMRNRCFRLWSGAVVNTEGDILPCCFDKQSKYIFGNLNDSAFLEAWHGDIATKFRNGILNNRKQYPMCRNCTS